MKLGITTRTQSNYETGKRVPDMNYLIEAEDIGIDLMHVLFGRDGPFLMADIAITLLEKTFGIDRGDLVVDSDDIPIDAPNSAELMFDELARLSHAFKSIVERRSCLDTALLADILNGVNTALHACNLTITPAKQAQAITMLYRSFKPSGKVEQVTIEEAVKLASS